jgi:peptidoglycan/xylan/chitin deacetylase (PgdA/CDA1 family)
VTKGQFTNDLLKNYKELQSFGIKKQDASFFLPPYEWYNDSIAAWTKKLSLQLINYTPGTLSAADYTTPDLKNYRSSETIYNSIINYEASHPSGLNGFILLLHIGTDPKRTDKFYYHLPQLVRYLKQKGFQFQRVDRLLKK